MDKEQEKIADILCEMDALHKVDYDSYAAQILNLLEQLGYRKLPEGKPPECENCFYKQRYQPLQLYDEDFGRITGTKRPKG